MIVYTKQSVLIEPYTVAIVRQILNFLAKKSTTFMYLSFLGFFTISRRYGRGRRLLLIPHCTPV